MRAAEINPGSRHGAGVLIHAKSEDLWLFVQRSTYVEDPLTWCIPGGRVEEGEDYLDAAIRETKEEVGYDLSNSPTKLIYVNKSDWPLTTYHTYAAVIDNPFEPSLNWESNIYRWCKLDKMPSPMHWGLNAMFNNDRSAEILHEWLANLS